MVGQWRGECEAGNGRFYGRGMKGRGDLWRVGGTAIQRRRRRRLGDGGVAKGIVGGSYDGSDTIVCGGGGGNNGNVLMAGARSGSGRGGGGSGTKACSGGGGSDDSWTPSLAFHEQPLEKEETLFFSQMTARVCGGGPLPLL